MVKKLKKLKSKKTKEKNKPHSSSLPTTSPQNSKHAMRLQEGKKLLERKRYAKAGEIFTSIMQEDPQNFDAVEQMAIVCAKMEKYDTALHFFDVLSQANPSHKRKYQFYVGCIYGETERYPECVRALDGIAETLKDGRVHFNLGVSYLYLGKKEESKEHYKKALKLEPDNVDYLCKFLSAGFDDVDEDTSYFKKIKKLEKESSKLSLDDQILLYFTLFKIYDRKKEYEKAMAYAMEAAKRKKHQAPYNREKFFPTYQHTKDFYNKTFFETYETKDYKPVESDRPVFIAAMPRSGTTLLEQILGNHKDIETIGEDGELYTLINKHAVLQHPENVPYPLLFLRNDRKPPYWNPQMVAEAYLKHLDTKVANSARVFDKSMGTYFIIGYIRTAFPNAKFIHIKRDAVDCCISMFTQHFVRNQQAYTYDFEDLAERYINYLDMMDYWNSLFPDKILNINYEDLVDDTEGTTKKVLEFMGMPWDENCLEFYNNKKAVKTASVTQVRQPIYKQSVARWKRYGPAIKPLIEALGDCASEEAQKYLKEE